jgi:hypothetical protein
LKARISQLHKTEAEWRKLPNFVPMSGEFIIYIQDEQHDYARIKIGDGITKLKDLPFFIDSAIDHHVTKRFNDAVDAGRVTDYQS